MENFVVEKVNAKAWKSQLLNARDAIRPLKDYQGGTVYFSSDRQKRLDYYCALRKEKRDDGKYTGVWKFFEEDEDKENKSHIDKLNIPSQDPRIVIVLDYNTFGNRGEKCKPLRLLETCSRWNNEFDAQIYVCAYVEPLSDDHSNLLARFDDPAFQRVFEGLVVVSESDKLPGKLGDVSSSIDRDESTPLLYIDTLKGGNSFKNKVGIAEEIIRKRLEE